MAVPCFVKKIILCKMFYDMLVSIPKLEYNIKQVQVMNVEDGHGILNDKRDS